ncbi:hypothetical protein DIS24_g4234 [Lasiodiplodia hormozganensis]|uniref:Uncharacterized protein n=1 Tax=Lasiodiplodia hormozganensis TaxID=869390 RepID=A0AA40D135_9PEZI|nr:hypothetical protein DIS24_g4234 [Lasiodiplodia hormozganensis]
MPLTVEVKTRGVGPTASPKLTPPRTSLLRNTPSIESISSSEPTPEPNTISPPPKPENPPIRPSSSSQEESEPDQTIPPAKTDVTTDADPPPSSSSSSSFILSPKAALSTCNDASRFTTFTHITPMQVKNVPVVPSSSTTPNTGYVELTATAIGTVKLPIGGAGRRLTLPNVLFVPLSPVSVIAGESLWGEKAGVWPGGRLVRGGGGGGGGVVVDREGRKRAWFRVVDGM